MSDCDSDISREKWLNYLQTVEPDQTPCSVMSDLGLLCLPIALLGVSRLQWFTVFYELLLCPRDK